MKNFDFRKIKFLYNYLKARATMRAKLIDDVRNKVAGCVLVEVQFSNHYYS